jgi:hypothetical protein
VYPQTAGNAIEKWVGSLACSEDFALTFATKGLYIPEFKLLRITYGENRML